MARLFIGRKTSGGGGAVKVMKNNADDPNTTPSTAVDKFLFDSEVQDIGYATVTYAIGSADGYTPAGSDIINCLSWRSNITINPSLDVEEHRLYFFLDAYLSSLGAEFSYIPYCDFHYKNTISGRFVLYGWYGDTGNSSGRHSLYGYGMIGDYAPASDRNLYSSWNAYFDSQIWLDRPVYGIRHDRDTGSAATGYKDGLFNVGEVKALIWTFPHDDTDFTPPSAVPVTGQKNVLLTPSIVNITRPGFDVSSASGRQIIADSERIPAKLLRSGSIASIAAGSFVDVPIGFTVPANTFVDGQFAATSDPYFSIPGAPPIDGRDWQDAIVGVEYEFPNGSTLRIWNTSTFAIKGQYLVFGSGDGRTSGNCPVLNRVTGSPDYVQLVRPGAAEPPNWDDIILDSRCKYLPLLTTGYIAKSGMVPTSGDERDYYGQYVGSVTVSCPTGYVPYVKAMCSQSPSYEFNISPDVSNLSPMWRKPFVERIFDNWDNSYRSQHTRRIRVEGSVVKFYCSDDYRYNTAADPRDFDQNGWAYWIFAVPDTL